MASPDNLYMSFSAGGLFFLIPFFCIKNVDSRAAEELAVVDFAEFAGLGSDERGKHCYIHIESGAAEYILKTGDVTGIRECGKEEIIPLGSPVIHAENRYLTGVVQKTEDGRLMYTIDPVEIAAMRSTEDEIHNAEKR